MPRYVEAEGLVLDSKPSGERHRRLTLLSPMLGLVTAMARDSRASAKPATDRKGKSPPSRPDIFDLATVQLEIPDSGTAQANFYFIREYKLLHRHTGLGQSYPALEAAAGLARLVAHNAAHFETCAPVYELCRKALEALENGALPEAVRLKALFLLASAEGYAAREQWLPMLLASDQAVVITVLNRPASEAASLVAEAAARLPKIRASFERWLEEHTDLEVK
jgi:hypothetical protein